MEIEFFVGSDQHYKKQPTTYKQTKDTTKMPRRTERERERESRKERVIDNKTELQIDKEIGT